MTENEKRLLKAYNDVVWMAIRYAHGRNTYAPSMVRDSVNTVKKMFPGWKLRDDATIEPPPDEPLVGSLPSDYLNDLFEDAS